jgi:hypothetical protein
MHHRVHRLTRRHCLKLLAGAAAAGLLPAWPGFAAGGVPLQKAIPGSNKTLPVIGMGTWRTFNVGNDPKLLAARTELVKTFLQLGGGLIAQPLIAVFGGSGWWQAQVFGIHADPTAMTTLGLALMLLRGWRLWLVTVIPMLWLTLSSLTLWVLEATEAWLLFAVLAAVLMKALLLSRLLSVIFRGRTKLS